MNGDIGKGTIDIEFERDWSVGLGATLDDATVTEKLNFFFFFQFHGFFPGKADSVILLGFKCAIIPQALMKFIGAIFEKIEILNFFLM